MDWDVFFSKYAKHEYRTPELVKCAVRYIDEILLDLDFKGNVVHRKVVTNALYNTLWFGYNMSNYFSIPEDKSKVPRIFTSHLEFRPSLDAASFFGYFHLITEFDISNFSTAITKDDPEMKPFADEILGILNKSLKPLEIYKKIVAGMLDDVGAFHWMPVLSSLFVTVALAGVTLSVVEIVHGGES